MLESDLYLIGHVRAAVAPLKDCSEELAADLEEDSRGVPGELNGGPGGDGKETEQLIRHTGKRRG